MRRKKGRKGVILVYTLASANSVKFQRRFGGNGQHPAGLIARIARI
jgi:hypothetical protein